MNLLCFSRPALTLAVIFFGGSKFFLSAVLVSRELVVPCLAGVMFCFDYYFIPVLASLASLGKTEEFVYCFNYSHTRSSVSP